MFWEALRLGRLARGCHATESRLPRASRPVSSLAQSGDGRACRGDGVQEHRRRPLRFREELRGASWHVAIALTVNASGWDHAPVTAPTQGGAELREAQGKC